MHQRQLKVQVTDKEGSRVKRKKSYADIMEQALRLRNEAFSRNVNRGITISDARMNRIDDIADRYLRNIARTKSHRNSMQEAVNAMSKGDQDRSTDIQDAAIERKYSRNTYMGLNGG